MVLSMSNFKENLLFGFIIAVFLIIGGQELWGFDRHAEPSFTATWYLTQTAPEYNALPKGNPTLSGRPHDTYDPTQLRLYEDTFEVALYTPATNRYHVIPAPSADKARALYEEIAVRYTYYIAKDRTTDIYNRNDIGRGDRDDISAGKKFLWYLFRADSNNGYGTDELHNKYHLDSFTVVYDYNEYLKYLHNFTYTSRYDYLDNNDLKGMKSYIAATYSKYTIWNNWHIDITKITPHSDTIWITPIDGL
jgi:hypothetical protein